MNVPIYINDDITVESHEVFLLVLDIPEKASGNGVVADSPNTTEITIIDNDGTKWLMV